MLQKLLVGIFLFGLLENGLAQSSTFTNIVKPSIAIQDSPSPKPFYGFGLQVDLASLVNQKLSPNMGFKIFRSSVGPHWDIICQECRPGNPFRYSCPPIGQPQYAFDSYVAQKFNYDCPKALPYCHTNELKSVVQLNKAGLAFYLIQLSIPLPILTVSAGQQILNINYINDYVKFLSSVLYYIQINTGVLPDFYEIINEPDTYKSAYIPPGLYKIIVQKVINNFIGRGFTTQILGPGTSQASLDVCGPYLNQLDKTSLGDLGAFSVHLQDCNDTVADNILKFQNLIKSIDAQKPTVYIDFGVINSLNRSTADYANSLISQIFFELQQKPSAIIIQAAINLNFENSQLWGLVDSIQSPYPDGILLQNLLPLFNLQNAYYLDQMPQGLSNLNSAAIRGTLNQTDSIVVYYWNANSAQSLNFRQNITNEGQSWKFVKNIRLDGRMPSTTVGFLGVDQVSLSASTGALFLYQLS